MISYEKFRAGAIGLILALGALLIVSFAITQAKAADKGGRNVFADAPEAPAKSWSGLWAGAHVGYGIAVVDYPGPVDLAQSGWSLGVAAGVDGQIGKHWVLGAFADYAWATSGEVGDGLWTIGARGGYLLTPNVLGYGLIGYAQPLKNSDTGAAVLGGGLEVRLGAGWSTKLEYRHAFVDDVGTGLDTDGHNVRLGLAYRF